MDSQPTKEGEICERFEDWSATDQISQVHVAANAIGVSHSNQMTGQRFGSSKQGRDPHVRDDTAARTGQGSGSIAIKASPRRARVQLLRSSAR